MLLNGWVDVASVEGRLITQARAAALWYEANLANRSTSVICADGYSIRIAWRRENFPHLTGLKYQISLRNTGAVPQLDFYNMLIHNQQLNLRRIGYTNNQMLAKRKCAVLMDAINPEKATTVFETSASIFALGIGSDQYCLGLVSNAESCLPMSVIQGSLEEQPRFTITNTHVVQSVRTY